MASQTLSFTAQLSAAKTTVSSQRRARTVVVRAQQTPKINRRDVGLAAAAAMVASLTSAAPAQAIFGLGGNADQEYTDKTAGILKDITDVLALEVSDPTREGKLKAIKDSSIAWVARYRRDPTFAGRPSYGNTYTAVNALTGHLNSFGFTAGIPKKRMERIQKEISDADKLLQRGR